MALTTHGLKRNVGSTLVVLSDLDSVAPVVALQVHSYFNADVGILTSMEAPELRHSASALNRALKAALRLSDIPEKAESVQQVRLARRIRTDDKSPHLERNIDGPEVSPVIELEVRESHDLSSCAGIPRAAMRQRQNVR
jgi:hypothetical protein